ncbi:MAG: hypothetical protein ACPLPR_08515 [Bacillota bacterium]
MLRENLPRLLDVIPGVTFALVAWFSAFARAMPLLGQKAPLPFHPQGLRAIHVEGAKGYIQRQEVSQETITPFRRLACASDDCAFGKAENVRRWLFEGKKLVLAADYLMPIGYVPRQFWDEIARIAEQRRECLPFRRPGRGH